ncbi:MAG: hypothetical protein KDJ48_00415 [Nitratireductor sp.]|nr:hypothetical protein [Nitratireductor sp.]MCB1454836.1 hypothetical protein [Nitratireductor sp.]MCB1457733.1 hypothetical protein [Nitratireductor sp.]
MQTNAVNAGQNAAAGGAAGGNAGAGNEQLTQAFDTAIQQAQQTLAISTEKGAQLYALKQRPQ